jgi:transcriptional regulator with GAF, ATPase, and Fis domain
MSFARHTLAETGLATSTTHGRTPLRSFSCHITSGESAGRTIGVGARPVIVGALAACDLVLDDPKVSGRHAELAARADGLWVKDLGSTNGTFVDGVRVSEALAAPGATVRFGATSIRVAGAPPPEVEPSPRQRFGGLVGKSRSMREVFAVLELASAADATVLIQGESGTGKELAARAIHDHSPRASKSFVVVDCSATTDELLESQLFGHRRGAFTGAVADRKGAFVEADSGTLFLDEIGELPLPSQGRLLRALEAHTVQPLGSDRPVPIDVRMVAATNRDLFAMVEAGTFRFDLFHRLAVVHVLIPPLRERLEDLEPLIASFYEGRGIDPGPIRGENLARLEQNRWRGNARELRNTLERAWVLSGGAPFEALRIAPDPSARIESGVRAAGIDALCDTSIPFKDAKERWNSELERRYLASVFERAGGNVTRAAEYAGLHRRHLRELLVRYGLKSE